MPSTSQAFHKHPALEIQQKNYMGSAIVDLTYPILPDLLSSSPFFSLIRSTNSRATEANVKVRAILKGPSFFKQGHRAAKGPSDN